VARPGLVSRLGRTRPVHPAIRPDDLGTRRYVPVMIEAMVGQGKVLGGHYINGTVSTGYKGDLIVQAGLKRRKLTADEVAKWEEITAETGGGSAVAGAVGKIVAGAVLPGFMGKVAGAALDATLGSTAPALRTIRVDWSDGKQSLIRLPSKLFTHLTVVLEDRQAAAPPAPTAGAHSAPQLDVVEQLGRLAGLRDQGVLTDEEFASKKGELLARL
jgi:Short C-terminal domain